MSSFAHHNMFLSNVYICYDREMCEMTTIFQTHFPNVVAAATVSSRKQKDALTSTDQQGDIRRKRHKDESTTRATVAPLSTSVHGLEKSINSSMPGIVNVIRVLAGDSQTAMKCQIFHNMHTLTGSATMDTCLVPLARGVLLQTPVQLC